MMLIELPEPASTSGRHEKGSSFVVRTNVDPLPSFPCAKLKLDQFFLHWLSENQDTVNALLEDVLAGRQARAPVCATSQSSGHLASPLSPCNSHALFSSTPPMSPSSKQRSPLSPFSPQRRGSGPLPASALRKRLGSTLPQFYFPRPTPPGEEDFQRTFFQRIDACFAQHEGGMPQKMFAEMVREVCDLPLMVGYALSTRLSADGDAQAVHKDAFLKLWNSKTLLTAPLADRMFHCLKQDDQDYLVYADLMPLMDSIVHFHPGLEFLKETSEFQKKYAETVVYRIFYSLNRSGTGRLSLRELRKSDLMDALEQLDQEDDINKVLKYFSYEHFYVIYCKFWELDTDHDFLIDRNDLAHYGQCALSYQIIDRIFDQVPRRFSSKQEGKMSYEDFTWFILSEEDKTSDTALEYWFRCADLDSDGCIRPLDMWYFYEEQLKRMQNLPNAEAVQFEDVVCQLHDMLHPEVEGSYTLRDLKGKKPRSGVLFNALFNLDKFLKFENRDPFAARAEAGEFAGLTEWDKFAKIEYYRLASEDDHQEVVVIDAQEGSWGQDDEAGPQA